MKYLMGLKPSACLILILILLGTVIFEMMNGLPPYYADDPAEMYEKILTNELQIPEHFSPEMADFVRQLLIRDPVKRLQDPAKIRYASDIIQSECATVSKSILLINS